MLQLENHVQQCVHTSVLLFCACAILQACKAAAAAVELAAGDPWSYHAGGSSSSYCHWLPQHAATLLQAYLQLGYTPPGIVLDSVLTALLLHWEFQQSQQLQDAEQQQAQQSKQQELEGQQGSQAGVTGQQLEQQVAAVQLLGVLAQMCCHPGERVSCTPTVSAAPRCWVSLA